MVYPAAHSMVMPPPLSRPTPPGGLRPALTPAAGTTPGQLSGSRQETRSLQVRSPRNQGNPATAYSGAAAFRSLARDPYQQPPEPQNDRRSRPDLWLFPSNRPGRHLDPQFIMKRLRNLGVNLLGARNTALQSLVVEVPPPLVAELLGHSYNVTQRDAQIAGQTWAGYVTSRPSPHVPGGPAGTIR